jgi:hypothetical protein
MCVLCGWHLHSTSGLYRERVFFEQESDHALFDLSDKIPNLGDETDTASAVCSFSLYNLSVVLPLPPHLQGSGEAPKEYAGWDTAVELHRLHEKALHDQKNLTRSTKVPGKHRRLIDLRSVVFIGGNGSGKSHLIERLARECQEIDWQPSRDHFAIERISARRKKLTCTTALLPVT